MNAHTPIGGWRDLVLGFPFAYCGCPLQDIKEKKDEDLLVLPTDGVLFEDPAFKVKQNKMDCQVVFNAFFVTWKSS